MKIKKGVMEKTKIKINKTEIELLEYIPDFYSIAEITNPLLSEMRPGIKTWVSEDENSFHRDDFRFSPRNQDVGI